MEEHRKEVAELKEKVKNSDANHQKQLQTKKFLIDKLKEERVKLQGLVLSLFKLLLNSYLLSLNINFHI